jgi:putative DNA primase/helicase
VIPLQNSVQNSVLKGLQFIQEDGSKSFPLPFKGLFHVSSDGQCDLDRIVIAEGYATARSIAEATGLFTIAAMAACNMKSVALRLRELLSHARIVIAADKDAAGMRAAEETSQALGYNVQIILPTHGNDFNDMLIATDLDNLQSYISNSIRKKNPDD